MGDGAFFMRVVEVVPGEAPRVHRFIDAPAAVRAVGSESEE
jgi:hypothetical protein